MAKTKIPTRLLTWIRRHKIVLSVIFFTLFFIAIFITSVAGGLRVFFPYTAELTGFPFGQKNYIILFQNNNELRPGGGFISSFGTVKFTSGIPTGIKIEDVYGDIDEHPYQKPPYPMEQLLANEWYKGYTLRDGNYSPNYPDSAREIIRLYHLTRPNEKVDGVIAINFQVLEDLLDVLGPIQVEGRQLNKDNLFEEITNQVNDVDRHNVQSLAQRKSILRPLADAIVRKIIVTPFKLRLISDTITRDLTTKNIQLYFANNTLETLARKNSWAGEWPSTPDKAATGDFLAVVEANLGGMKSDRYIRREITYHVRFPEDYFAKTKANPELLTPSTDPQTPTPTADLTINLHHYGIENIPLSGPYTGYFRIFNSPGQVAQALSTERDPQIQDATVKLQMGEEKTLNFQYNLPRTVVKDGQYSIYIPKQSGTSGDIYNIIVELPRGFRTASDTFTSRENFATWTGPLTRDTTLSFQLLPDRSPPNIILQENKVMNRFDVHFNEDLNQDYASDPFSYEVTDLNLITPAITDQLRITKVETTSKDIEIYTTGETSQPEERYGVRLKNLRDTHGNVLTDRQITLVQRIK